ncbi:hypothetical protein [Streptomyces roseolus]|uniref:hypothetical protein n=1 Tax=Streptomyces roseolus TaxID=67358 RepID=UPI0037ACFC47
MRSAFHEIPLATLFPFLSPAAVDSMQQTVSSVDAARAGGGAAGWEWDPKHAASPGPQPWTLTVLGLDVIEDAAGGDQVEFQLQAVWTDRGRLAVDAAVNVACWCDTDHAGHDVDALRIEISEENPLPEAFRMAARRLTGWLAEPHDADHWRAEARLPARPAR